MTHRDGFTILLARSARRGDVVRRFWSAVAVLTVVIGGALVLADLSAVSPATRFPPYLETDELKPNAARGSFGRNHMDVVESFKTR